MQMSKKLEIGDLYLAVFIKSKYGLGMRVKKESDRCLFVFDGGERDCQELIASYYNGNDAVSANKFVRDLKDLKAMVHNM